MVAGLSRWELFPGDGQAQVISCVEEATGLRKCLEDPFNPESEALETLSSSLKNISVLIIPPCSARTIEALRAEAPELKSVIIADNDTERLDCWRESFAADLKGCEVLSLPKDLHEAEAALRERLMQFECEIFLGSCAVYIPRRFRRFDKDFSEFLETKVLYLQHESCSAAATRSIWSWRSTLNQLLNAPERPVSRIAPKDAKEPGPEAVVIVGAGPSLDTNIKDLKEYADRAIIISTDAALNTMLENDVRPDLVASMDSGPLMWRIFERNIGRLTGIPLAASLGSSHVLYRAYPGSIALFTDSDDGSALKAGIPCVEHGKCVGHFAFHLAESLRPETIVMVGFDLAYRDGQFHASGMPYKCVEDFKRSYQSTSSFVEAAAGGRVQTDLSLEIFLRYFEDAIAACPCKVVDATEGGALKRGARLATLRETLSAFAPARRPLRIEDNPLYDLESKAKAVRGLRDSLERLSPKLLKSVEEAHLMSRANVRNPLKELDLESSEFKTVSACANFLLMAEWVKALKAYPAVDFAKFKGLLEALSEDLLVCSETISAAILAASKEWRRDSSKSIVLAPEDLEAGTLSLILSKLEPDAAVYDAKSPLHQLWREMVRLEAGRVICVNGNSCPELWSVPRLPCFDIKTAFNPSSHDKTIWLPGYCALCLDEGLFEKWREHLPKDVDCRIFKEVSLNG